MNKRNTIIMIVLFFIGLLTLFYPTLSNYYNEKMGSKTIYNYENILNSYDIGKFKQIKKDAINYNKKLSKLKEPLLDYDDLKNYNKVLNVNNEGMIGYLSIDKIRVEIPIYHGTSNDTLNSFVGHIEGTSLPIGGKGTHSVLSAHRGLPSAKLFSDLDRLELGDTFKITVLDEVLTYEVDKISIVKPNNSKELKIDKNNDYVTLLTCTPYGINTHRLLVHARRVPYKTESTNSQKNTLWRWLLKQRTFLISTGVLVLLIIYSLVRSRQGRRQKRRKHKKKSGSKKRK